MARIDYNKIKNELALILRDNTDDVQVHVEPDMLKAAEATPWIGVYMVSREVPQEQPIAAGRRVRVEITMSLWLYCYALELDVAERARDKLLGDVELILMQNRTLNDTVEALVLIGGELPTNRDEGSPGFFSGAEIRLVTYVTAEV